METLRERNHKDRPATNGTAFFLKDRAGVGKPHLLSLLRDGAEAGGMLVGLCAPTGIAASLYKNVRKRHSLLGIGIEARDSSELHAKLSNYGPQKQRAALIRALSLLIIDEASMMQRLLFKHGEAILMDLRCTERCTGNETDLNSI